MSLPAILDAIRASGRAQLGEIEADARRQIAELEAAARREAERVGEASRAAAVAPAVRERARILHHARLAALQITGDRREALVDAALDQTRGHLEGLRTDAAYPAVLQRLTEEALGELAASPEALASARLAIDPRDDALMRGILSRLGLDLRVGHTLTCWGGVVAESEDGRVVVINTLEARLERATPALRRYLAGLFENEGAAHEQPSRVVDVAAVS